MEDIIIIECGSNGLLNCLRSTEILVLEKVVCLCRLSKANSELLSRC